MNKYIKLLIIPIVSLSILIGCANYTSEKTIISDNSSNNSSSENIDNNTDKPNSNENTNNNTGKPNSDENPNKELLETIKSLAKEGKTINSEFAAKKTVIGDVKEKLGEPDSSDWIAKAKGIYDSYPDYSVAFGYNKGSQIFEVRSFDTKIKSVSLNDMKEVFGSPDYNVTVSGEEILGYVANDEFKLLFVFPAPSTGTTNPKLDHYSVLYPQGTANSMSNDPGREW